MEQLLDPLLARGRVRVRVRVRGRGRGRVRGRGRGRGRVRGRVSVSVSVSPPLHAGHDHALEQVAQPVRLVLGGELLRVEHVDEEAAHHDEDHRAHAHLHVPLLRLVHVELVKG